MKPAVRKLIERRFQFLDNSHPRHKEIVQWEMIGYGMALQELKLIDSVEYMKLYSDASKIRTLHDRIFGTLDKLMDYAGAILFVAVVYLLIFLFVCICIYITMNAGAWLGL